MSNCSTQKFPVSRKKHKCCECSKTIEKGEIYQLLSGIYDNEPFCEKTCLNCAIIRDVICNEYKKQNGFCDWEDFPSFGELFYWIKQIFEMNYDEVKKEFSKEIKEEFDKIISQRKYRKTIEKLKI